MTAKTSCLLLAAFAFAAGTALAGPETVGTTNRSEPRSQPVVKWHEKIVTKVLVACGVVEPVPVYVAPGYLETTGPAPMLLYRAPGPMPRRRSSTHPETEEKSAGATAPAASPPPVPSANPLPSLPATPSSPAAPAPASLPADAEPGVLPETDANGSTTHGRTDELLSYFQRQRPAAPAHSYNALPVSPGGTTQNDSGEDPAFLQTPLAPEQPVLPPSRATYHVAP